MPVIRVPALVLQELVLRAPILEQVLQGPAPVLLELALQELAGRAMTVNLAKAREQE